MPRRPPTPCLQPGCPALSHAARCDAHAKARERMMQRAYDQTRPSKRQRGYGPEWKRIRDRFIQTHRVCQWPGCSSDSNQVDHIVSIRQGGTHEDENLQALCRSHHSYKTATQDGGGTFRKRKGLRRGGRGR